MLCRLDELGDPGAKGIAPRLFVVRRGGAVFAYVNSCRHLGSTLDWRPDTFLSPDKRHIQCATHGAIFRIEDGVCVAGPCLGAALQRVAVRVEGGTVVAD